MSVVAIDMLHKYYLNKQCDHTEPPEPNNDQEDPSAEQVFSVSIGVVLLAFMASEVLIMALCKIAAWYAHVSFYSQFSSSSYMDYWDDDYDVSSRDRHSTIHQALSTRPYGVEETERNFKEDLMWCSSVNQEEPQDTTACPICLLEFEGQDTVSSGRSCHHLFHKDCISQWLQKHSTCPYCRADMFSEPKQIAEKVILPELQNNEFQPENNNEDDEPPPEQEHRYWGLSRVWTFICRVLESRDNLDLEFCMFLF